MLRDLHRKVEVMQASVEKVERAACGILVRGSERPNGWTPDLSAPMEMEAQWTKPMIMDWACGGPLIPSVLFSILF